MKIQKVLPIQDRQYQDQQGQQRVFTSSSLVGYLNEGDTVRTQLSMGVRDWQDQQGQDRYENRIYISTIKKQ